MTKQSYLNHVAILVPSIERAVDILQLGEFADLNAIEQFPSEGTRELYLGGAERGHLLLLEAIAPGPYQSALERRGPGLHHVAIDVLNIEDFVGQLHNSGWFLLPKSLGFLNALRQVWLARPGMPMLIEMNETKAAPNSQVLSQCHIHYSESFALSHLLKNLQCDEIQRGQEPDIVLQVANLPALSLKTIATKLSES